MKKLRMLKKVLSMVIATAMIIGTATMVTGCDKKNESGKNSASSSVDAGKTKKIVNYYTSENKGMPEGVDFINSLKSANGKLYSFGESISGENLAEFYNLDQENGTVERFDLEKSSYPLAISYNNGKVLTASYDGTAIYVHGSDNKCELEISLENNGTQMVYGLSSDKDGNIYALILKLTGMSYDTNVLVFDKEGNKIKEENLSKKINASGLNLSQFLLNDGQDNFYFVNIVVNIMTGQFTSTKIYKIDKDFNIIQEFEEKEFHQLTNIFMNQDNNLVLTGVDEAMSCCYINEIDSKTGEIASRYEIPGVMTAFPGKDADHLTYYNSDAIYSYDVNTQKSDVVYALTNDDVPESLKSATYGSIGVTNNGSDIVLYAIPVNASLYALQVMNTAGEVEKNIPIDISTDSRVDSYCISSSGQIWYAEEKLTINEEAMVSGSEDEDLASCEIILNVIDEDGNKINSFNLPDFKGNESTYVNYMTTDKDDNIYMHVQSDSFENGSCLYIIDKDGNVKSQNTDEVVDDITDLITSAQGDVYIKYTDKQNNDKPVFAKVNAEDGKFGEAIVIDGVNLTNRSNVYSGAGENSIYIDDGVTLYGYNFESKKATEIVNWIESDFSESFTNLAVIDENTIACIGNDYKSFNSKPSLLILTKADEAKLEQINNKKVITAAGFEIGNDIASQITKFNKSSDTSRIQVYDYSQHNTADDENKGIKQFNNDIVSGNVPDIILANTNLNMDIYAKKGMFADLNTFIEKDADIKKEDYLQNIFEIGSYDGKLCQIIPSFTLDGLVGKTSLVGAENNWTVKEFKEFVDSFDGNIIENVAREDMLTAMAGIAMSDYVDFKESKCDFDNEDFITLLELIKEIGVEEEVDLYDDDNEDAYNKYEKRFWNDECALDFASISGFSEFNILESAMFKEEVTLKGMPSGKGSGITVRYGESFAISEKSENKDEAWEFVREYLLDDYQNYVIESDYLGGGFPVKLSTIDEMVKKAQDSDNNLYSNYPVGDEMVQISVIGDESAKKVKDILGSVTNDSNFDVSIMDIIKEEAELFFKDEATSAETAASIQNKVKLYLDEVK